jgi:hypothetical protein
LVDKFTGDGKPLPAADQAVEQTRKRRPPSTVAAIDAPQCKRISVQDKPLRRDGCPSRRQCARFSNRQKRLGRRKFCLSERPYLDKQILPSYGIVPSPPAV